MYEHCFFKLLEAMRKEKRKLELHLTSFVGHSIWHLGVISFQLTLREHQACAKNMQMIGFTIIQSPSTYNIIFGRSSTKKHQSNRVHNIWPNQVQDLGMIHNYL